MRPRPRALAIAAASIFLGSACAQRPVNPPLKGYEKNAAYEFEHLERNRGKQDDLVILAFSGGGTRAAAFSYGVLEALRRIEVTASSGEHYRLLDEVDLITGVSGGSFTALAYGLYGEKIFDDYEQRFLKRDVQGALVKRVINPLNWGALWSKGWGRSELAANLYDEILFHGATFADLERSGGPAIIVGSTDLASGSRVVFVPQNFDVMCADLGVVPPCARGGRLLRRAGRPVAAHDQQLRRRLQLPAAGMAHPVHEDRKAAAPRGPRVEPAP